MLFNSLQFVFFLVVVLLIYYRLNSKAQNLFLLVVSCFFYASWNWRFLFPLLFSTSVDYYCAMRMQAISGIPGANSGRKRYLYLSVVSNLTLLAVFKYFGFFVVSAQELLKRAGFSISPFTVHIVLPIGISFYTFQALSYTIDVYRGQLHSTSKFSDFLLAVLYFPHLVAGPIQRAHSLLPQVVRPRAVNSRQVVDGLHLMLGGYFKKMVIADNLEPIVTGLFAQRLPTGFDALMGVYAFAVQIYCDFSGYTDIARGIAKIMGFEFMLNFNLPYFATNPSDFWTRWHISLSSWLRDYLYIPLGGNRCKAWKVNRNLMVTMVLGGLWHGAAWNFVLWGFYHGTLLMLHRAFKPFLDHALAGGSETGRKAVSLLSVVLMFHFTCFGWLLFRAEGLPQILTMSRALLHPLGHFDGALALHILAYASPLILAQTVQYARGKLDFWNFPLFRLEMRMAAYAAALYGILFLGGQPTSFIYFQF